MSKISQFVIVVVALDEHKIKHENKQKEIFLEICEICEQNG